MTDQKQRQLEKTIEALSISLKELRVRHNESCTEHKAREKELLKVITVKNRKITRQGEQLDSRDQAIKHLRENKG